jgi:hypothetical protein
MSADKDRPEATDQDTTNPVTQARDLFDCITADLLRHGFIQGYG